MWVIGEQGFARLFHLKGPGRDQAATFAMPRCFLRKAGLSVESVGREEARNDAIPCNDYDGGMNFSLFTRTITAGVIVQPS